MSTQTTVSRPDRERFKGNPSQKYRFCRPGNRDHIETYITYTPQCK